jgi:hypothetical protein
MINLPIVKIFELLNYLFQFPDVILRVELEEPSLLNTSDLHVEHVDLPPIPRLKNRILANRSRNTSFIPRGGTGVSSVRLTSTVKTAHQRLVRATV